MLKLFEFILRAKAQSGDLVEITPPAPPISNFEGSGIEGILLDGLNLVLIVAGGLALIAIVYSAIMYITSGGDESKAESAKKNLIWAISGFVVILLSAVIIRWVQDILTTSPV